MATWKQVITTADDSNYKNSEVSSTDINANVSANEFGYLNGVTSGIQGQIDACVTGISTVNGSNETSEKIRVTTTDGTTDDIILAVGGGLSIANGTDTITISNTETNTDTNVDVSTLETRLSEIDSSVTIGDSNSVVITTAGNFTATGDITVGGNDIKGSNGTTCIQTTTSGNVNIAGDLQVTGNNITGSAGTNVFTFSGNNITTGADLTVTGDLTVSGTTTTVNTTELLVEDEKIVLGSGSFANDAAAITANDGGGIALVTDSATAGNYANLTWNNAKNLTGWCCEDTANAGLFEIAVMEFSSNSTAPSGNAGGVGSLHFDTGNAKLYVRTA